MIPACDRRACLVSACFVLGTFSASQTHANDKLWAGLVEGGKVILMRHASVMEGREHGNPLLRDPSCRNERNLSTKGKREARIIGERFRQRNVPISEVRHSPFCRTVDTARIAFGGGIPTQYLSLLEILPADEAEEQTERLMHTIGSYVGAGNLVLVTHGPNISAVSFELIKRSDFLVLQPRGDREFDELGVVTFSEAN